MKIEDTELRQMKHWGRRQLLSGCLMGLWIGALMGAFITVYFELAENWSFIHFMGMIILGAVILLLGRTIGGEFHVTVSDEPNKP